MSAARKGTTGVDAGFFFGGGGVVNSDEDHTALPSK
jgi:hypothetical protein